MISSSLLLLVLGFLSALAAHASPRFTAPVRYDFNQPMTTVTLQAGMIKNDSRENATGSLKVQLWACSSLVSFRDGQADQRLNLLNVINREMAPDFRKSKAEAYNELLPFILIESKIGFADQGKNVRVKTAACNDPNEARAIEWTANYDGRWSIAESKWLTHQLTSHAKKIPELAQ
jgi:hypothetical protein